jgi:hypothetical protein
MKRAREVNAGESAPGGLAGLPHPEVRGQGDTSVQNGGYFGLALSAACG